MIKEKDITLTLVRWRYPRKLFKCEYSCAVKPSVRQAGNRLSGPTGTAYASLLA